MAKYESPYLEKPRRLADLIAAIQAMGVYPWASREVPSWAKSLDDPLSAESWENVFREHPEFFRFSDDGYASLRWRHAYERIYRFDEKRDLAPTELEQMTDEAKRKYLSRRPLDPAQIETLLKTAIELHSRAIALRQESRWWIPLLAGLGGVIVGALTSLVTK